MLRIKRKIRFNTVSIETVTWYHEEGHVVGGCSQRLPEKGGVYRIHGMTRVYLRDFEVLVKKWMCLDRLGVVINVSKDIYRWINFR